MYLSRTNNTKAIAEIIHRYVGGTLAALELEKPYSADYQATVQQAVREKETGFLPPLKTKIDRIEQYDMVFLGFPTWGMQLPPPIKSFLRQYDLRGKAIVPFNTNAGYGVGSSFDTVKEWCRNSKSWMGLRLRAEWQQEQIVQRKIAHFSLQFLDETSADKRSNNHIVNLYERLQLDLRLLNQEQQETGNPPENARHDYQRTYLDLLERQRKLLNDMNHRAEFDEELIRKYLALIDLEEYKIRKKSGQ